jgi:precorrin-6B methylase 2
MYAVLFALLLGTYSQAGEIQRAWFSHWSNAADPVRAQADITRQTLAALDLQKGHAVADIGAGSGFYAVRIAARVGPNGSVTATEANLYSILSLYWNRTWHKAHVIQPVWQSYQELVPAGSFDRMLMFNVFPFRRCTPGVTTAQLEKLAQALRPSGKLVIVHDVLRDPGSRFTDTGCGDPSLAELSAALPHELKVLAAQTTAAPQLPGLQAGYVLELGLAEGHASR